MLNRGYMCVPLWFREVSLKYSIKLACKEGESWNFIGLPWLSAVSFPKEKLNWNIWPYLQIEFPVSDSVLIKLAGNDCLWPHLPVAVCARKDTVSALRWVVGFTARLTNLWHSRKVRKSWPSIPGTFSLMQYYRRNIIFYIDVHVTVRRV